MEKTNTPLEIERKFLIKLEQSKTEFEAMLRYHCERSLKVSTIVQTYLTATEGERRVRSRVTDGEVELFYTEKVPVTGMKRVERERTITADEYKELLNEADPQLMSIVKTRYTFEYQQQVIEIDLYAFSDAEAILEIELASEDTEIQLPHFVKVIKEVTDDKAYKNHSLAKTQKFA